jgi:aspartate/methionine/tyrosine aminotransferase
VADVTIILGERKLQLTRAEANQLHDLLVERNLALLALLSELSRALQEDAGQPDVLADEEIRQELLLCLEAGEVELRLTEGLRKLRQAARVPISPRPEY